VLKQLAQRPQHWKELHEAVRPQWWLETHLNAVVKELETDKLITFDPIPGKSRARTFTITANPMLRLAR